MSFYKKLQSPGDTHTHTPEPGEKAQDKAQRDHSKQPVATCKADAGRPQWISHSVLRHTGKPLFSENGNNFWPVFRSGRENFGKLVFHGRHEAFSEKNRGSCSEQRICFPMFPTTEHYRLSDFPQHSLFLQFCRPVASWPSRDAGT